MSLRGTPDLIREFQAEKERCDDFGELLKELSGGRNVLFTWNPPTSNGNHSNSRLPTILDCGCGSGAWITSFLDEYGSDFDVRFSCRSYFAWNCRLRSRMSGDRTDAI